MIAFISGGCKNGKSTYAQNLAKSLCKTGKLCYVATMIPHDEEDDRRIARHLKEREGWGFETVEQGTDIDGCVDRLGSGATVLLDSVTALLSNEMFGPDGTFRPDAGIKTAQQLRSLCLAVDNIVLVSDYLYSDAQIYDEYTEAYRRGLAHVDRELAKLSDTVMEVCFGNIIFHRGELTI
ncbi:MAG: bifunctional adenosylcobinamide kinase/adenosylcobinamide-phosphate guanylyltransferase [Oscillospiraceae bacterium]|nr:bifunctional adenosylcobinamide kinase/adenosylcobinamide-phosphate guanylyltransferase [Oscillospiraceae bacterium]